MSIAWNDIFTVLVAIAAASISLFTFVYQNTLKPRLDIQIGQEIIVWYTADNRPILASSFVFLNKGAQPTTMTGLFGTIWIESGSQPKGPNLMWKQFEEIKRVNDLGGPAEYVFGSSGIVETLVIPGRGTSSSHIIRLYSDERLALSAATYVLSLQAVNGSTRGVKGAALKCSLHLNGEDAKILRENGAEKGGRVQVRISFKRKVTPAGSRNSRAKIMEFESDGPWGTT